jgi:DNA mismatch repair protein mutS
MMPSENEYSGFSPNETADIEFQTAASQENPAHNALAEALNQIRPDDLTPREALDALYRLKQIAEGGE